MDFQHEFPKRQMVHLNDVGEEMEWLQDKKSLLNSHNYSQQRPNNHQSFRQARFKRQIANLPYDEQVKALRPSNRPFGYPDIFEEIEAKKAQKNLQNTPQKIAEKGLSSSESEIPHKAELEQAFQQDFSSVKVHTGPKAKEANQQLDSEAYTLGNHIVFGTDNPSKKLVAHELTHTVQQQAGIQLTNGVSEPGDSYEQNADAVANKVSEGKPVEKLLVASKSRSSSQQVQKKEDVRTINYPDWIVTAKRDAEKQENNHLNFLDENTIVTNKESINSPQFAIAKGTKLANILRVNPSEEVFNEIRSWQETFKQADNVDDVLPSFCEPILNMLNTRANSICSVVSNARDCMFSSVEKWKQAINTFFFDYSTAYKTHTKKVDEQTKMDEVERELAFSVLNLFTAGIGKSITTAVKNTVWLATKSPWAVEGLLEFCKKTGELSVDRAAKEVFSPSSYQVTMEPSQMGADLNKAFGQHFDKIDNLFSTVGKTFTKKTISIDKSSRITANILHIALIDTEELDTMFDKLKQTEKVLQSPPAIPGDLALQLEKGIWAQWIPKLRDCPRCSDTNPLTHLDDPNGERSYFDEPGKSIEEHLNKIIGLDIQWGYFWTDASEFMRLIQWAENWTVPENYKIDI